MEGAEVARGTTWDNSERKGHQGGLWSRPATGLDMTQTTMLRSAQDTEKTFSL